MPYLLSQTPVEDFEKWKAVFDEHAATRRSMGSSGGTVMRNTDDPNQVTVLLEWDDLDQARAYAESDDLRQAMQNAGVILTGAPVAIFLEEVDKAPA